MEMYSLNYKIIDGDFSNAGNAGSDIKKNLKMPGLDPAFIKRVVVSIYEAEVNMIAHANGGNIVVTVDEEKIVAVFNDVGPGIPDINLAMQKGFSTASDEVRQPGFGAAMGLPNIQKNSDKLLITTEVGKETQVTIISYFTNQTDEL